MCLSKSPLDRSEARRFASRTHRPYRCPFALDGHWHTGHLPSLESMQTIAAAIRNLPKETRDQASGP